MKKLLLFVILAFALMGCGDKVHDEIREDMADDTKQILTIMDQVIADNSDLSEKDEEVFDQYYIKYSAMKKASELTEEEDRLFILVEHIIENPQFYTTLESDKESYENTKKDINNVIKTGQIYD